MWRALPLLLGLALAACGPQGGREALTDSRIPPGLAPRFMPPAGWAWGVLDSSGQPQIRYGVSGPDSRRPAAHVVIVPAAFEPAESWFETASDLNAAGYAVWTIERPGLGGSGRYVRPHDMAHSQGPGAEGAAIAAVIAAAIRPGDDLPIVILAAGDADEAALSAIAQGAPAAGLILSAPPAPPGRSDRVVGLARRLGLGALPAGDWRPWSRQTQLVAGGDPWRAATVGAWSLANPDLRLGGGSLAWRSREAPSGRTAPPVPTLVLSVEGRACAGCTAQAVPGASEAPQLDRDEVRDPWRAAILAFVAARAESVTAP